MMSTPSPLRRWTAALIASCIVCTLLGGLMLTAAQEVTPTPAIPADATPTITPVPRPLPVSTQVVEAATVEFFFAEIPQGGTGLFYVNAANLQGVQAVFLDHTSELWSAGNDGFYGFLSASMEQTPRQYDLDLLLWYADGIRQSIQLPVTVSLGQFLRQDVNITGDKAYLVDPTIERAELARLDGVFAPFTLEHFWDEQGFDLPIPGGELTSAFGAFRTFNGSMQSRHTGWDLKAGLGQPILAAADGKVAFTGTLEIRGGFVAIDHGYGVYSTYSHFQQVHVTQGQSIVQGQVLGTVGATGRTSGPHFHWEVAVNGVFVDAAQFLSLWKS
jgi:murein DD-endopeptidase MepM/ murein hydrolase activator NlpD